MNLISHRLGRFRIRFFLEGRIRIQWFTQMWDPIFFSKHPGETHPSSVIINVLKNGILEHHRAKRHVRGIKQQPELNYSQTITVCPRSSSPYYIVSYYTTWVITSWSYSTVSLLCKWTKLLGYTVSLIGTICNVPVRTNGRPGLRRLGTADFTTLVCFPIFSEQKRQRSCVCVRETRRKPCNS